MKESLIQSKRYKSYTRPEDQLPEPEQSSTLLLTPTLNYPKKSGTKLELLCFLES